LSSNSSLQTRERIWPDDKQAAVTLSFDDGYQATYTATVTLLSDRGWGATYNLITDLVGSVFEGLPTATWAQWEEASRLGHELASHTARHTPLAGPASDWRRWIKGLWASPRRLAYLGQLVVTARALGWPVAVPSRRPPPSAADLRHARLSLEHHLGQTPVESLAYPAGRHSYSSRRAVVQAGFSSARTLDPGLNRPFCDPFALRAVALGLGQSVADLIPWLERAQSERTWLIIVLHLVAQHNSSGYPYFCPLSEFEHLLDELQTWPVWIATQDQVIRHWRTKGLIQERFYTDRQQTAPPTE
jgi:peptidoglycan/xylan/chitin deacetylase (PgdA/CDA1 family)